MALTYLPERSQVYWGWVYFYSLSIFCYGCHLVFLLGCRRKRYRVIGGLRVTIVVAEGIIDAIRTVNILYRAVVAL